jgi:hypothetical protein
MYWSCCPNFPPKLKERDWNITSTKVDAGNLKHELLNWLWSILAVNVLKYRPTIFTKYVPSQSNRYCRQFLQLQTFLFPPNNRMDTLQRFIFICLANCPSVAKRFAIHVLELPCCHNCVLVQCLLCGSECVPTSWWMNVWLVRYFSSYKVTCSYHDTQLLHNCSWLVCLIFRNSLYTYLCYDALTPV